MNKIGFSTPQEFLYETKSFTGPVHLTRGEGQTLCDGDTLKELKIRQGEVINLRVEPEKNMNITCDIGYKNVDIKVKNSVSVKGLKNLLIDSGNVGCLAEEFELLDIESRKVLTEDESLALWQLHVDGKIAICMKSMSVECFDVNTTNIPVVCQITKGEGLPSLKSAICEKAKLKSDIFLFVKETETKYRKLSDQIDILPQLGVRNIIYFYTGDVPHSWHVLKQGKKTNQTVWGRNDGDTVLSMRLRVQEQLGIAMEKVKVFLPEGQCSNDASESEWKTSQTKKHCVSGMYMYEVPDNQTMLERYTVHVVEN